MSLLVRLLAPTLPIDFIPIIGALKLNLCTLKTNPLENILFLGCGSWGGALGVALANKGYSITMWHRNNDLVKLMEESRTHYLIPSLRFPKNVSFKSDISSTACYRVAQYTFLGPAPLLHCTTAP